MSTATKPLPHSLLRRILKGLALVILTPVVIAAVYFLYLIATGRHGIIAHATAPDGTECMVTQQWGGEPFTVAFYSRRPGAAWRWQYLDHEANCWWNCQLMFDGKGGVTVHGGDGVARSLELNPEEPFNPEERKPPFLP